MAAYHVVFGNAFGLIMARDETHKIKDYQFVASCKSGDYLSGLIGRIAGTGLCPCPAITCGADL